MENPNNIKIQISGGPSRDLELDIQSKLP